MRACPLGIISGAASVVVSHSNDFIYLFVNYKDFILNYKGKTILVVGHSNTIPKFANNLINEKIYQNISDTNNSNLYVINICENSEIINRLYFVK